MARKSARKKSKSTKAKLLARPKQRRKRGRKGRAAPPMEAATARRSSKKRGRSRALREQRRFARDRDFERKVTEKTLRDILALRCVHRCTR